MTHPQHGRAASPQSLPEVRISPDGTEIAYRLPHMPPDYWSVNGPGRRETRGASRVADWLPMTPSPATVKAEPVDTDDASYSEVMCTVLALFPEAEINEDDDGELVIHTRMRLHGGTLEPVN